MHAKNSEEKIHATQYLQEILVVVVDPNVLLFLPPLPLPSCSKTPSMPHSSKSAPRKDQVSKSMSERIEKELQN